MIARTTGHISPAWESLRRQMRSGGCPAGSGRALRLDPFCLPCAFCGERCRGRRAGAACGALSRARGGAAFARAACAWRSTCRSRPLPASPSGSLPGEGGGASHRLRRSRTQGSLAGAAAVRLGRGRRRLCRMAHLGQCAGPAFAGAEDDGALREPFARHGRRAHRARPRPRRRRHNAIKRRRPSMPLRRKAGKLTDATPVHRGEREIIARN